MNKSFGKKILAVLAAAAISFTTMLSSAPITANAADNYIYPDTVKSSIINEGRDGNTTVKGRSISMADSGYLAYKYNGSIYTANSSMYDYLSDEETRNEKRDSEAKGYCDPYVLLNWEISKENYDFPLYFGCFYRGDNSYQYTSSNKGDGWKEGNNPNSNERYKNFYWQANISLRKGGNSDIHFDSSVQGLVDDTLKNGTISQNNRILPYFSKDWANSHSSMVKYWDDISFPFYGIDVAARDVHGDDNRTGTAKYYQFNSRELNLQLETNDSTKTGKYKESNTQIYSQPTTTDAKGTVCYLPFNNSNGYTTNNLGFGTYFDINFRIQSDGKVETVDSNGKGTGTYVNATFEFMGDDDVWVFIDDKLVLDLGGAHKDTTGLIDFADKKAYANSAIKLGAGNGYDDLWGDLCSQHTVNLKDVMTADTFNSDDSYNEDKVHNLRMFYMERGMYESDLLVRFNFSAIPNKNTLKVREITNFEGINSGLVDLTKKAADYDVFNYSLSNKGTSKDDVGESGILTPTYDTYQRQNQGLTAKLTGQEYENYIYLDTSQVLSGGNKWNSNNAVIKAEIDSSITVTGEKVEGKTDLYRFKTDGGSKVEFSRVDPSSGKVWNSTGKVDFKENSIYKITDWGSVQLQTEGTSPYKENNFDPTNSSIVKNTNYIWTDEFAAAKPDTMTGTTDDNGTFNLMYGSADKESSGQFNSQFKKGSYMYVNQNDSLKTVKRDGNVEDFSSTKSRTVSEYYDTTVSIVDKEGYAITNGGTVTNTNYSYSNTSAVPAKDPVQITETFTNTPKVGALSVEKLLEHGDTTNDNFEFTVELTDIFGISEVQVTPDTYANVVVTIDGTDYTLNSSGAFSIKGGQTAVISGIPYGTKYKVTETNTSDNYQSVGANSFTGTIGEDTTTTVYGGTVTNTRLTNSLTLSKSLLGNFPTEDKDKFFTFSVTLTAPDGVDLSQYNIIGIPDGTAYNSVNGTYTFTVDVSNNSPVTITGIPYGTQYSVYEPDDTENWLKPTDTVTGTINSVAATAELKNTFVPPPEYGNLKVSKTVLDSDGSDITSDETFRFTVTLKNTSGKPVSDVFNTVYYLDNVKQNSGTLTFDTTGKAEFSLGDNESIVISDIPVGVIYTVVETANAAYDTSFDSNTGSVTKNTTSEVNFTNTKKFIPYTLPESGFEDTRMYFVFALSGMMLCGLAYWYINREKLKKQ